MKYWFVWALAALLVFNADAAEKKAKGKGKGKGAPIAKFDADKDGKVSLTEFVTAQQKAAEKAEKEFDAEKAEQAFKKKDANNDGFLTKEEMVAKKGPKKKAAKTDNDEDADEDFEDEEFED